MRWRLAAVALGCLGGVLLWRGFLHGAFSGGSGELPELAGEGGVFVTAPDELVVANASPGYLAAVEAMREGDHSRAVRELEACGAEDGACLGLFGELHLVGAGVPRNFSEAVRLFTAGADLGDADSQYNLGVLYSNMLKEGSAGDMRRDEALSVLHLYAASIAGHPGALMALGYRHAQGEGVPKACSTAVLNYIEVARRVTDVYSAGIPQAVELVRLGVDGRDKKAMSASEVSLFVEIARSGDANVAAAVGKRYLLGIEGFRQSYQRAAHHLQIAADKNHGGAMALLGYMYCLGLGVAKSLDVAYSYFVASTAQDDALGHNGLGYIYFHGTSVQAQDLKLAFKHFNASAYGGSADGMFNLASLYLTGTGAPQSFQQAAFWYTQALDRGHTPAAYTLAVMHLNGIGAVRNCKLAVDLLKRVCERGSWVSRKLQEAYDRQREGRNEEAAWLFLRLAEAGHEVAQMNLAHLMDTGSTQLLLNSSAVPELSGEARTIGRVHAQRQYELSAEQGNALSELRLGDYAYYGWGLVVDTKAPTTQAVETEGSEATCAESTDGECDFEDLSATVDMRLVRQEPDVALALARYKRTAAMRITSEWMQPFVARASFNLGYMYQFGIGVVRDMPLARRYYNKCAEVDPAGVQTPVALMLALLAAQAFFAKLPPPSSFGSALLLDLRIHMLVVHFVGLFALVHLRGAFAAAFH